MPLYNPVYGPGGTDVAVSDGGTGASTASDARTNLGLSVGSDVQAYDADLLTLATSFAGASASGPATLAFHEDTDNGTNKITLSGQSSLASDVVVTLPGATTTIVGTDTSDTLSNKTLSAPTVTGAISLPDDVRQTFNPGAANAGLNVGAIAGDPTTPSNGDLWYDSTANELTARINGANVALGAGGGGANAALSNLAAVAINASLISDTNNTDDLGSGAISWANAYVYAVTGSDDPAGDLALRSTTNATKGLVKLNDQGGGVQVGGGATASELRIMEASGSGTNYTGFVAQALAANVIYTLPAADGSSGQFLSTNGGGTLSWATASGGSLSYFTEARTTAAPNATVPVHSFTATGAELNIDAAFIPKGTGAILADIPDSTSAGGNKRGIDAVDLQMVRDTAAGVASGDRSVITGGANNGALGTGAVVSGGYFNEVNAAYSSIPGGYNNQVNSNYCSASGTEALAGHHGEHAYSSGKIASQGDSQHSLVSWRKQTASATQAEIFLDNATSRFTVASDTTYGFEIHVVARRTDVDGESSYWIIKGCIDNNAGTTSLVGSIATETVADDSAGAWSVTAEADNTNDALVVKVTGGTAKTINWTAAGRLTKVSG